MSGLRKVQEFKCDLTKLSGLETRDQRPAWDSALYPLSVTLGKRVKSLHPSKYFQGLQNPDAQFPLT